MYKLDPRQRLRPDVQCIDRELQDQYTVYSACILPKHTTQLIDVLTLTLDS